MFFFLMIFGLSCESCGFSFFHKSQNKKDEFQKRGVRNLGQDRSHLKRQSLSSVHSLDSNLKKKGSGFKTISGDFASKIKVLNLKTKKSSVSLNSLSRLKWVQNKKQWGQCVKIAENIKREPSIEPWLAFNHLTCMVNWYKTRRGLKIGPILLAFDKLKKQKDLLLKSHFPYHKKSFIDSFLDLCELISKYSRARLEAFVNSNKDLIDFMEPRQSFRYGRILNQSREVEKDKRTNRLSDLKNLDQINDKTPVNSVSSSSGLKADKVEQSSDLLENGKSLYYSANFKEALKSFKDLIKKHPGQRASDEARYLLGLLHYRLGNYKKVISLYRGFLKNPNSDPWELQIRYWLWHSLRKTNSMGKAGMIAETILKEFPLTYYGLIVRQEEKNELQSLVSRQIHLETLSWETRGTEKQWKRIEKLLSIGWVVEAKREINRLPEPETAEGFIVRGLLWHSAFFFNFFIKDYTTAIDKDPHYISGNLLKMVFPKNHKKLVFQAEKEFSIPADLIWAIIRQESSFMETVISPSKAYGLMQILIPTGVETARWLRVRRFHPRRDIFKPKYNIRFGTHYLSRMLRKYRGVYPLAIGSYNVGPGNMDRWLEKRTDLKNWKQAGKVFMDDLWMDELPWAETSFYVKAVLRNYLLYKIIHKEKDKISILPWSEIQ